MRVLLILSVLGMTIALPAPPAAAQQRSFADCQRLVAARGISIRRAHADRYLMLKGFGAKTKPTGFMARCLAGEAV